MQNKSDSKNHNQTNHLVLTENGRNVDKLKETQIILNSKF